ncbi:hypothetical protein [Streptomyces sp. 5-10]|uniref:hypothetical protein n=1 Tax=Streptomyces sp. 5-10 TaxID=878925 RepID=UPI00168B8F39|nr:hypothetical protein [Streptomyces sp. 5-10]MBD3004324.1 hypothetical protein [Streptomyces sp. 5-10]
MSDTILTADETATDDEQIPDAPPAPDHAPAAEPEVPGGGLAHTPGGLPAVPLTVIGANSTVAAVSASVLTAGAPITGLAAAGIAATAAGAAALRRRSAAKKTTTGTHGGRRHGGGNADPRSGRTGFGSSGRRARHGSSAGHAGTGRAGGSPRGRGNGAHAALGSAGRSGARSLRAAGQAAKLRAAEAGRSPRGVKGAFGAVKAARADRQAAAPTRAERRRQDTADRRNLSDARRAAKAARKAEQRATRRKGSSGRGSGGKGLGLSKSPRSKAAGSRAPRTRGGGIRGLVGSARERMRQAMRRMRSRVRAAKDERTARRLAGMRELRKRAWARWRLWRRLTASALRCYGRKVLAAAISVPFFAIGMITHPIGVRLGWRWLMWPGQRVYARLAAAARRAREERDFLIRAEYKATLDNAAAEEDEEPIGSRVRRAPRSHHAYAGTSTGGSTTMSTTAGPGFLFNESASEMEAAAKNYDPDGMMHVHDTIKGFPEALASVANTFAILAQKSDEEFPLEPEVGTSLDAIYQALQLAIDEAEEAFTTFRVVHEQDIRRHEEPRNNAEEGWDTTNNQ